MLAGSFHFADKLIEMKKQLIKLGHEVFHTDDLETVENIPEIKQNFDDELKQCIEHDVIRDAFKKIKNCDALFVCNYPKNGIEGYLGTSVLMELAVAYHYKNKIFLLNDFDKNQGYGLEIAVINPIIIHDDLSKLQ